MLNCWCITWPVGFKRLNKTSSLGSVKYVVITILFLQPGSSLDHPKQRFSHLWGFLDKSCFRGWGSHPHGQPQTWPCFYVPPETGMSSYNPGHQKSIVVASYDTNGLRWLYSPSRSPHGKSTLYVCQHTLIICSKYKEKNSCLNWFFRLLEKHEIKRDSACACECVCVANIFIWCRINGINCVYI